MDPPLDWPHTYAPVLYRGSQSGTRAHNLESWLRIILHLAPKSCTFALDLAPVFTILHTSSQWVCNYVCFFYACYRIARLNSSVSQSSMPAHSLAGKLVIWSGGGQDDIIRFLRRLLVYNRKSNIKRRGRLSSIPCHVHVIWQSDLILSNLRHFGRLFFFDSTNNLKISRK